MQPLFKTKRELLNI